MNNSVAIFDPKKRAIQWIHPWSKNSYQNQHTKLVKIFSQIVKALDDNLFNNGYKGIVILGAEGVNTKPYFDEIVNTNSPNLKRIYLTMDSVKMSIARKQLTYENFKNILYNTGATACSPFHKLKQDHLDAIKTNVDSGKVALNITLSHTHFITRYFSIFEITLKLE